jgi:predicted PurR-regulated permease PerM
MHSDQYRRAFLIATVAILGIAVYRIMEPFWGALAWGICLAFLLGPVQIWLAQRLGGRPGVAAGVLTALTPFVLLLPLAAIGFAFAGQVTVLVDWMQSMNLRFDATLLTRFERWPLLRHVKPWILENATVTSAQVHDWLLRTSEAALKGLASVGGSFAMGALGGIVSFCLMLFLLFFLLRDGPAVLQRAVRLIPLEAGRRTALLELVANTTRAVAYGTVVTALVQGALVGIGFAIAGLPAPVVFGVFAALCSLLPSGGAALVWVPGLLWLLGTQAWGWAIFMGVWGAGVSVSDNILRPLLISTQTPVSTLAVFIGVIGGVTAFGAIGLIAGPVLLTLVLALLRFLEESR